MKSNLLLDVAELALTHLTSKSSVSHIDVNVLYKEFMEGKTLCKDKASFEEFKIALRTIFPIYKNKRKHTVQFKISSRTAYSTCETLSLKLRPLTHIKMTQTND